MLEMHLRQSGFTYSACEPSTRNKKKIQKFMQTGDTNDIYKNELDKASFPHDMASGKYKELQKRAQSNKVLKDKAFEIANNPRYDGYQKGLVSMTYKFFDKKSKGIGIKNEIKENEQLATELHKSIIRKFKKRKVWGVDLTDM